MRKVFAVAGIVAAAALIRPGLLGQTAAGDQTPLPEPDRTDAGAPLAPEPTPLPGLGSKWVATWAASIGQPYAYAAPSATDLFTIYYSFQPDLQYAILSAADGLVNQSVRMVIKPDIFGNHFRLRFSNLYGTAPLNLDRVALGIQASGAGLVPGSNRLVTFNGGNTSVSIPAGGRLYSDAVELNVTPDDPLLAGRKLAVSMYVAGPSGTLSVHNFAFQTSYLAEPGSGDRVAKVNGNQAFPYTTTSSFIIDQLDVEAPAATRVLACLGDSLTDGVFSTINGDDRYPNYLSQRLHTLYGNTVSVVNAGIGGDPVLQPGGALDRLERDVLSLSGVTDVIWFQAINDFRFPVTPQDIIDGYGAGVQRMHAAGISVTGATVTSSLHCTTIPVYATDETNAARMTLNAFIRTSGLYDHVADFDTATVDPTSGELRPAFSADDSKLTNPSDKLHFSRLGNRALANAVDLAPYAPAVR